MYQPLAIITGAASGIGLSLTKHLLVHIKPWRVVMTDLPTSPGQELADSLGPNALFVPADVSIFSQQRVVFEKAFEWGGGRIDFLAANAGMADTEILHDEVDWDGKEEVEEMDRKTIDVDLVAVLEGIWLFKHYATMTKKNVGDNWVGRVVMTSSPAGLYAPTTLPLYVAAKAGLIALTYSIGPPFASSSRKTARILVNTVLPGFVKTGLPPQGLIDVFPAEHVTPMSTILRAFEGFLEGDSSGRVVECSLQELHERKKGEGTGYVDESTRWLGEESHVLFRAAYEKVMMEMGK